MLIEYDIVGHGKIVEDRTRWEAYLEAIRRAVRPGSVVVDIGTGTGVFAIAACRAGARRVYAIEPGGIVQLAREIVAANGCASQIDVIDDFAGNVVLPEPADLIIADCRGVLPDQQIPILLDARRRFLKDGGCIIPRADTLWAAPVTAPDVHARRIGIWHGDQDGLDMSPARQRSSQSWWSCRPSPEQFVAQPQRIAVIDYEQIQTADIAWSGGWTIEKNALVHGFVIWFDTLLHDGVSLTNSPWAPPVLYGQGFFPIEQPVTFGPGARIHLEFTGRAGANTYDWKWNVQADREHAYA